MTAPRADCFPPAELSRFAEQVLVAVGTDFAHARDMAAQILGSETAGHESHGFRRLTEYVDRALAGHARPGSTGRVVRDDGNTLTVDGEHGFGHVVMRTVTTLAIERARAHGIAAVALRKSEYVGRFADFCAQAADAGIVTLMFVNCSGAAQVAGPPGALVPRLGTNPIAAGVPRATGPHLVIDMATTAVAMGRIAEWRDRNEPVPDDWVNDHDVLQHAGGTKGFALALLAEALAGALTGAGTVAADSPSDAQGVMVIAIDPQRFCGAAALAGEVDSVAEYVRNVPLEDGAEPVRIPGESLARAAERETTGSIELQPHTAAALIDLATRTNVVPPAAITPERND